jgi:hypothetical protein
MPISANIPEDSLISNKKILKKIISLKFWYFFLELIYVELATWLGY